jgi:hypothetical protein
MTRLLALKFVTATLLANPAAARGPIGFALHPGFIHPGFEGIQAFFLHRNFVNNRFFF